MTTVITEQTRNLVTVINESPQRLVVENSESVDNIVVRSEGVQGSNGVGVPVGGTAGQVLAKIDGTNYNTEWVDDSGGVTDHTLLTNIGTNTHAQIDSHIASTSNPHSVTKSQVGLGNVDNTSDLAKPISTATQTALDLKVDENAAITGATKTKITYDAKGLVTAGTDATTADIADSSNKRYVTDAHLTVLGNTSGTNSGNVTLGAIGSTPNSNGATLTGQVLNLEPASSTFGGVLTVSAQSIKGSKTFESDAIGSATVISKAIASQTANLFSGQSSAGVNIGGFLVDGKAFAPLGTAALPSYTFISAGTLDSDTGMWSSGANSVSFSTSGAERIRIGVSNSGFINIGGNYTTSTHSVGVTCIASNVKGVGIKAANGQSANIFDYLSFAGTVLGGITSAGGTFAGDTAATANKSHIFKSIATTSSSFAIKAITSQTPNLLDLVNSAGTTIAGVTVGGQIYAISGSSGTPGFAFATSGTLDSNTGFYTPGADRIAFTNNSAQSLEVSALGRTHLGANFTADTHQLLVSSKVTTIPTLGLRSISAQTADFLQWVDFAGTGVYGRITNEGKIRVPSGTVGTGAYAYGFESDTDTGIYQSAGNNIDFGTKGTRKFNIDDNGNLSAYSLHNNLTANGGSSRQDIRSGSGGASVDDTENVNGYSSNKIQWLRVGNVVTVSGAIADVDVPGGGTLSIIYLKLPVGSHLSDTSNLSGTGCLVDETNKVIYPVAISSDGGSRAKLSFYPTNAGVHTPLTFHFTYEVLG